MALVDELRKLVDTYGIGEVQETLSMIAGEVEATADRETLALDRAEIELADDLDEP